MADIKISPSILSADFSKLGDEIVNLEKAGYRLLTNVGDDGHQEVQHLHFHILGGQPLGSFIKRLELD